MRGFSGHFPPGQLLYLWDLVLAYDSMEVCLKLKIQKKYLKNLCPAVPPSCCSYPELQEGELVEGV